MKGVVLDDGLCKMIYHKIVSFFIYFVVANQVHNNKTCIVQ